MMDGLPDTPVMDDLSDFPDLPDTPAMDFLDCLLEMEDLPGQNSSLPEGANSVETREIATQTDGYVDDGCCVDGCRNRQRTGRRCRAHLKTEDVHLKVGTPKCLKCDEESYSNGYRYCRIHEMEAGNLRGGDGDFFARRVDYKTCISRRCYRAAEIGWRCKYHEKRGVFSLKFTVQTCIKCEKEVYGEGYIYCSLHK